MFRFFIDLRQFTLATIEHDQCKSFQGLQRHWVN